MIKYWTDVDCSAFIIRMALKRQKLFTTVFFQCSTEALRPQVFGVHDNGQFNYKKDKGLVTEVFNETDLEKLGGHMGIGHVLRYAGSDAVENAQPIVIRYTKGHMAVALNGGLTNTGGAPA